MKREYIARARLNDVEYKALEKVSRLQKITISEAVRTAIKMFTSKELRK